MYARDRRKERASEREMWEINDFAFSFVLKFWSNTSFELVYTNVEGRKKKHTALCGGTDSKFLKTFLNFLIQYAGTDK
jgi:hypothetical protein